MKKTKKKNFLYSRPLLSDSPEPEMAFRNAFRRYKNAYLAALREILPIDDTGNPSGYAEFCSCDCSNPIKREASGQLSVVLGLETSTCFPPYPVQDKDPLVRSYRQHHFVLRGVRKFYHSRLVQRNSVYKACLRSEFTSCSDDKTNKRQIKYATPTYCRIWKSSTYSLFSR